MSEEEKRKDEKVCFEDAMKRVEEIVQQMERGELGLDELVAHFEEGQRLIKLCTSRLSEVERKIDKLVKGENGEIEAVDFEQSEERA